MAEKEKKSSSGHKEKLSQLKGHTKVFASSFHYKKVFFHMKMKMKNKDKSDSYAIVLVAISIHRMEGFHEIFRAALSSSNALLK